MKFFKKTFMCTKTNTNYKLLRLFLAILIYGITNIFSQEWVYYTIDDGLASSSVYAIVQDDNDNMWFTGGQGASKYDGVNWTIYTEEDGLAETYNYDLLKDINGNIWFSGSSDSAVTMYDGQEFYITEFAEGSFEECIYEDVNGNIWFGDFGGHGIMKFDGEEWTYFDGSVFLNHTIYSIYGDSNGNIYAAVGWSPQVFKFDGNTWETFDSHLNSGFCWEVYYDSNNRLWFFGDNDASFFDGQSWANFNLDDNYIGPTNDVSEDSDGNIWISNEYNKKISVFDGAQFTVLGIENGILDAMVMSIKVDWYDNIWVGYYGQGVAHYIINEYSNASNGVEIIDNGDVLYVTFPLDLFNQFNLGNNIIYQGLTIDGSLPDWITFDDQQITFTLDFSIRNRNQEYIILKVNATDDDDTRAVVAAKIDISSFTEINEIDENILINMYPNPVGKELNIKFQIDNPQIVKVQVYNSSGQLVESIVEGMFNRGLQSAKWVISSTIPSGMYCCKISTEKQTSFEKIIVVNK